MSKQVFETKWGYVAYSYGDYRKLKELNKIFQKARINAARWNRWARKEPQNRVQRKWIRNEQGQKIGHEIIGSLTEPAVCDLFSKKHRWFDQYVTDNTVELEYRKSRKPLATESDVIEATLTSARIDSMLVSAKQWLHSL